MKQEPDAAPFTGPLPLPVTDATGARPGVTDGLGADDGERRLSLLVADAGMLDARGRAELLDRECGADADLRRRAEARLDALAAADTGDAPGGALELPRAVGSYDVLGVIGTGGMGAVLRARCRDTGRLVAIKCVRAARLEILSSIRREIHALARLCHPGIVRILDEGVHDGAPWYAMEVLDGTPLASRIPAAPREATADRIQEALTLARSLCVPLSYLHGEGIVHRDLKPQNVLLRDGAAVLVDFGLATTFGGAGGRARLAMADPSVGTPSYMAPEQAMGRMVDARADIYALGCILYELLTGRPPFRDARPHVVLRMHVHATPEPPSALVAGIPPELDDLVLRLLRKEPRQRIGHADDVAARLAALGAGAPAEPSPHPPRSYLYQPGLVGRSGLVAAIERRVAELPRNGGGIVLLSAESGAGKTRVLAECALGARGRGHLVLEGECTGSGDRPLECLVEPLLRLADACRERGDAASLLGPRVAVLSPFVPSLPELLGLGTPEPPPALEPAAARLRLWSALGEVLAGGDRPALLILDDLQWADDLTLGFLAQLPRSPHLGRLLVVGAYRADEAGAGLSALAAEPGVTCHDFGGLEATAVSDMVAEMLALEETPRRLGSFLAGRAEGNPFFVAEYLRLAVDEGLLRRDAHGVWRLAEGSVDAAGLEGLRVPASMGDLLDRRLAGLGEAAGALARRAAVVGRDVERDVLALLGSGEGSVPLLDAITELLVRHVVVETAAGYRFAHDRLREAAEASIDPRERPEHHRRAAEAIEAIHGSLSEDHAGALGRHWESAGDLPRAAGLYRRAAARAESRYALDEAEACYRRHIAIEPGGAEGSVRSRIALGGVLGQRGRLAEAEEALAAAIGAPRGSSEDGTLAAEGLVALSGIHMVTGRAAEAEAELHSALASARAAGAALLEGRCLHHLAKLRQRQGRIREAEELARLAIALGSGGDLRHTGRWEATLASILVDLGRLDEARPLMESVRSRAHAAGIPELEAVAIQDLAAVDSMENRPEEALTLMNEALQAARRAGDRSGELTFQLNVGATQYMLGRAEDAHLTFRSAVALAREIGDGRQLGVARAGLGTVLHFQGDARAAREELEQALRLSRKAGDRYQEACVLENIAQIDREEGRVPEARAALAAAVRIARDAGYRALEGVCLGASSMAALLDGDLEDAAASAALGEGILRETAAEHELQLVACIAGHVELAQGRCPTERVERARLMAMRAGEGSVLADSSGKLERAAEAASRGEALLCGHLPADLSEGERSWIARRRAERDPVR